MPCEHPLTAYRPAAAPTGRLVFTRDGLPPRDQAYTPQQVPCGTCILCREEHARQTAVRISHEAILHDTNCFVTLTYNDQQLPPHGSLRYADLAKFWKRLRKEVGTLRYYAAGEYGDTSLRAHYHACIFGHDFTADRIIIREDPHRLWTSPLLARCWGLGNVSIGTLNFQTARYTASYVTKKLRTGQQYVRIEETTGELVPLQQPRAFMSRNLGKSWWDLYKQGTIDHDRVVIEGRPQKPPKAYDKWLKNLDETIIRKIKDNRQQHIERQTAEQNRAHARNAHARAKRKTKTI